MINNTVPCMAIYNKKKWKIIFFFRFLVHALYFSWKGFVDCFVFIQLLSVVAIWVVFVHLYSVPLDLKALTGGGDWIRWVALCN